MFTSTNEIWTSMVTFCALFNGGVFKILNRHPHGLHGLFFPTNIFLYFSIFFFSLFLFCAKKFKFVGMKIDDVRRERKKGEKETWKNSRGKQRKL